MTDAQLIGLFGQAANNLQILEKCNHLCTLFGLSEHELFANWEAFAFTEQHNSNLKISVEYLDSLQKYIQDKLTLENKLKLTPNNNLKLNHKHSNNHKQLDQSSVKKRKLNLSSSPVKESHKTIESNQLLETFNSEIKDKETTIISKGIKLTANFLKDKYKYRTMNLKLLEIADYLDERIDNFAKIVADSYKLEDSQFADPTRQSQSEIYTVGRIVPDSPTSETSELNLDSLFLETSRSIGFGCRIPLDVSDIKNFSFFPGQIVAFRGINANGTNFKVLENLKLPYLGSSSYSEDEILKFANIIGDDNLKVVIASGPYHPKASLNFTHLENFIKHMNNNVKPDIMIMLGPFIDINTIPNILTNSFFNSEDDINDLKNLDDLFNSFLSPILNEIKCQRTILIPHTSDISNPHIPYPQPSFNRKILGLNKNFKCFPNPSCFNINELSFGISNTDIFRDLKDIPTPESNSNRIERIFEHILYQRQFYPVNPSPMLLNKTTFPIDTSYLGLTEFDDELPEIFILPSVVKAFAKIVKNTLVINPGSFLRSDGNKGTYSLMQVKCPDIKDMEKIHISGGDDDDDEEVVESYLSSVWKRAKVDIYTV